MWRIGAGLLILEAITASALVIVLPSPSIALTVPEIAQIAEQSTVLIESQYSGSGVIISRRNDTYYVLTAAHVVQYSDLPYTIVTPDQQRYELNYATVEILSADTDLAILEFTSSQAYVPITIANSDQVTVGTPVFIGGYPDLSESITQRAFRFVSEGQVASLPSEPLGGGYALVYSNNTVAGMSGGPVLDSQGRLIGIHGQAETERQASNESRSNTTDSSAVVRTDYNYGIPINTFVRLADRSNLSSELSLRIDNTPLGVALPNVTPTTPQVPANGLPTRPAVINSQPAPAGVVCPGRQC